MKKLEEQMIATMDSEKEEIEDKVNEGDEEGDGEGVEEGEGVGSAASDDGEIPESSRKSVRKRTQTVAFNAVGSKGSTTRRNANKERQAGATAAQMQQQIQEQRQQLFKIWIQKLLLHRLKERGTS